MGFISYCMTLPLYIMSSFLTRYSVLHELNTLDAGRSRSMCGVIVVDAESFRSTCHGRDAYIHDHCLDNLITMLNSVNCSTVICSPTVEYLCSWEKPLVKPMAPGSILIISISITLFTCFAFTFYFASLYQKYQKILSLSDLTLVSDREGIDNP